MHEPIDLVNPINSGSSVGSPSSSAGEAIGAMSSTGDMNEGEVEQKDRDDPTIHAGRRGEVGIH